jgi:tetraacyldisaccharide 4'-kinase
VKPCCRAPRFWTEGGPAAALLMPIAALWGAVAARRMARPAEVRAPIPVVVVGNPTAGGAGKTPTVIALVALAREAGFRPAVLSRGYGGRLDRPHRVDRDRDRAIEVGDEPLLLAAVAPTVVARRRPQGLPLVAESGADLLLLDDGFQNPALARDLAILVIDRGQGIGNGRVLPAGPLRAPLADQLARADLLVLVATDESPAPSIAPLLAAAAARRLPVVTARLRPTRADLVAGRRVLAYAGIGRPEKFAASLAASGAEVVALERFADHRPLGEADAARLLARAEAEALLPVTTEKDAARAGRTGGSVGRLIEASVVFPVEMEFDDPTAVRALLIAAARGSSGRRTDLAAGSAAVDPGER